MSKETKLMKNTAIIAVGNILTKCISFLMLPLYTALLSTEQYGTVDLISTYSALLLIVITLQFEQGVFRYLIEARDNPLKQKKYVTTSILTVILMIFFSCFAIGFVLYLIDYEYTVYFLSIVALGTFYSLILQIPRGLGKNAVYAAGSAIYGSLHVILNVIFIAVLQRGVYGMLEASLLSQLLAIGYIVVRLRLLSYLKLSLYDEEILKELLKYSLPLIPYTLCWWIINASDRTIIQKFLGTGANGIYAVAYKFPSLFSLITNIFQMAWTESASENADSEDRDSYYNEIINKSVRFYSSCNMAVIALLPFVFPVLINRNFADAYNYTPLLLSAALFHSIAGLYGSIYFAFKQTKRVAFTTAIAAITNIGINLLFINQIGLYAAAISSLIAYFVIIVIRVVDLRTMVSIHIKKSYFFAELVVYAVLMYTYYCGNLLLSIFMLLFVCVYAFLQNRFTIEGLFRVVTKKVLHKKEEK